MIAPPPLLVLAGGFGTRLRAAVPDRPKPLAPVLNKPFLEYLIDNWVRQGVDRLVLLLHHEAAAITRYLAGQQADGRWTGCQFRTLREHLPLGTGGAVAFAVKQYGLAGTFLVANADTWLDSGISDLAAASAPAVGVVHVHNSERYGRVRIEGERVADFEEKRPGAGEGWINAGLYRLDADLFRHWDGRAFSLERELLPKVVGAGQLRAVRLDTAFVDIGIPDDYFRFCRWVEAGRTGVP